MNSTGCGSRRKRWIDAGSLNLTNDGLTIGANFEKYQETGREFLQSLRECFWKTRLSRLNNSWGLLCGDGQQGP